MKAGYCLIWMFGIALSSSPSLVTDSIYCPQHESGQPRLPIRVMLRNQSSSTIQIIKVAVRNNEVWPARPTSFSQNCPIEWCQVWPHRLRHSEQCEVKMMPTESEIASCSLEIHYKHRDYFGCARVNLQRTSSLYWQGIRFDATLTTVWCGARYLGKQQTRISRFIVNGLECKEINGLRILRPGKVSVFGAPLPGNACEGEDVFVIVETENGNSIAARVRAVSRFPISAIKLDEQESLALDEERFWKMWGTYQMSALTVPSYVCLMGCPSHRHGTEQEALAKLQDNYLLQRNSLHGSGLGYVFVCKSAQFQALEKFGSIVDGLLTNPLEGFPAGKEQERGPLSGIVTLCTSLFCSCTVVCFDNDTS